MIIPIESASFVTTNQAAGSADLETVDERIAEDVSLVLQSVKQRKLITNQTAACKEMKKVFPFFKGFSPAVTLTNANEASFYESLFVAGEQRSAYREDMTIAGIESYSKTMPEKRDLEQVVAQVNEFLLPVNRPVLQMDRVLDAVKRESPQVIYTFLMNVLHQLKQQEATKHVHPLVSDLYGDAEFQTALTLAQKNNSSDSAYVICGFVPTMTNHAPVFTKDMTELIRFLGMDWQDSHSEMTIKDVIFASEIVGVFEMTRQTRRFIVNRHLCDLLLQRKQGEISFDPIKLIFEHGIPINQTNFDKFFDKK